MIPKFKRQNGGADQHPQRYEPISEMPSETIPDQALTVQQLLDNHVRGINSNVQQEGQFEMELFGDEINPMRKQNFDLTDIDDIRADLEEVHTYASKVKENEKKQAEKAFKDKIIEDYKQEQIKNTLNNQKTDENGKT